tara:strand:- start:1837 stop:2046 length:210 start_codon:yes stop_codon:yes gene_type:complete
MKVMIEATPDQIDKIILSKLSEAIQDNKADIKTYKKMKNKEPYQKEDLRNFKRTLQALEEVYDYYGGNL